jgi:hypothetical protein
MGLLDEAIREHLELKRRRGADPEVIAKEEHDALGPVRREPDLPPAAEEPERPAALAVEEREEAEHAPAAESEPPPVPSSRPLVDSVPEEPLTPRGATAPGQSTEEWSFEDEEEVAHEEPAPQEDEDVLEETPDFLQETPEHDRLWFEQKPPRDFDFDG